MKAMKCVIALVLACAALAGLLSGCGGKKLEAGDYSGSVRFDHTAEISVPAMGGGAPGSETVDKWGGDVIITIDEDGIIWNIQANQPEDARLFPSPMAWTVFGGKFLSSITGTYTCADIMKIKVDVESDGFPVLTGDCGGIHLAEGQSMTLLNDHEVACALILLAMQDAITANGLN